MKRSHEDILAKSGEATNVMDRERYARLMQLWRKVGKNVIQKGVYIWWCLGPPVGKSDTLGELGEDAGVL